MARKFSNVDRQWLRKCRIWKRDPAQFVRDVFKAEPSEDQLKILNGIAKPGAKISARSGHGTGKTTCLAWVILWMLCFHADCKIPCTAPSAATLFDGLWPELHKWHLVMPPFFKRKICILSTKVVVIGAENTRFASARTSRKENPEAMAGFHATNLLFIIDEASGVYEKVFEVAEGALSTPGARVIMTSNPTRLEGYFHRSQTRDRALWTVVHLSCLRAPYVDQAWVARMKKKYGENSSIYRIRVLGEFPKKGADILIALDLCERAQERWKDFKAGKLRWRPAPKKRAGLDVARYGDDASALVIRDGGLLIKIDKWYNLSNTELAGRMVALWHDDWFDEIYVDGTGGHGSGVIDILRDQGVPVVEVNVSTSAADPKYGRLRDELWFRTAEWFEDESAQPMLPVDEDDEGNPDMDGLSEDLISDLVQVTYKYDLSGRLKVEDKDSMKEKLLHSPDVGDALCLTFADSELIERDDVDAAAA